MSLKLQIVFLTICILVTINSCVSVARMNEFPKTSQEINFNEVLLSQNNDSDWSRTLEGRSHFVILINSIDESQLIKVISQALIAERYKISRLDSGRNVVIGKRGMTPWEWKSITGVYYEMENSSYKVYLMNSITQDFIGGFNFNRAQKVATTICNHVNKCTQSETGILEEQ